MVDITAIFSARGPLDRAFPAFEPRPQQVRMAAEVMAAMTAGRHLLVEAGTGIGKSLAYLVPAILWATRETAAGPDERRVVISTHTRALQEQLARKDLPFLERALLPAGIRFTHALLMGSANYLCVQRLAQHRLRGTNLFDDRDSEVIEQLWRHAGSAPSGLRSEIPFAVPDAIWSRVCRDRDICLGARGPLWDSCLYRRDLWRSREAHLLVVNHALYFLDLATGGRILPPHQVVILDEAHRVEEVASSQFGSSVSSGAVARLLEDLHPPGRGGRRRKGTAVPAPLRVTGAAARAREVATQFFTDVRREAEALHAARSRADTRPGPKGGSGCVVRVRRPGLLDDRLRGPLQELEDSLDAEARSAADPGRALGLQSLAARARELRERISVFLAQRTSDSVYWIDTASSTRGGSSLHVTPVEIAPILRQRLFDRGPAVILTSATLTTTGSFSHVRTRLGLTGSGELALGSPFDFERQALLYTPPGIPDPVSEPGGFAGAIVEQCRELIRASGGGAFVLFTSYALLNRTHEALSADPELSDIIWLRHESGAASAILEEFRATRRGVLLGTLTFWQGVDVPGEALRSVIITRLPFEVPDHPVAEARSESIRGRGGDPFVEDSLPQAILTFRQGFGRLIRTRDDHGLVAILDPRVRTRGYGAAFLESLPSCRSTDSLGEVSRFFSVARS